MEVTINNNYCIITPLSPKMDEHETERLVHEIALHNDKNIGIDLSWVEDCTIDFLDKLYRIYDIGLFNISSNILVLLFSMGIDKNLNLYVSLPDFLDNKRRLLNRKFHTV